MNFNTCYWVKQCSDIVLTEFNYQIPSVYINIIFLLIFRIPVYFSDMHSVSNLLAGEFLVDVHKVCSESCDEDVTQLQSYLQRGRGGVILRVLQTIGVQVYLIILYHQGPI
jgi:hypothetical protein